jgi:aldose 1-epimerase
MRVEIIPRGAVIRALHVPDRHGKLADVVLGYDDLQSYVRDPFYLGAVIGRYANRIARGRFTLDGQVYQLSVNDPPNHLHGGVAGFHAVDWTADADHASVVLRHVSAAGTEGYPGSVEAEVRYTLNDANELAVEFRARSDAPTPLNLTQHSYFNLRGAGRGTIDDHELRISADHYLPVDATNIPTGELREVKGTEFDFTRARRVLDGGRAAYDHCYALREQRGELSQAAELYDPESGRVLTVLTTEPGMQLYTGQFLQPMAGKQGTRYQPLGGICLETQHFPDAPNQPSFPSTIVRPGEEFRSTTVFRFSTRQP